MIETTNYVPQANLRLHISHYLAKTCIHIQKLMALEKKK